jgi:hypothetical protein
MGMLLIIKYRDFSVSPTTMGKMKRDDLSNTSRLFEWYEFCGYKQEVLYRPTHCEALCTSKSTDGGI